MEKAAPFLQPSDPTSSYLSNLSESILLLISEDPALLDAYEDHTKERLKHITSGETNHPYRNFYQAEIYLQRAFVRLKLGSEWSAAWDFRRAYKLIQTNIAEFPDFLPHYKSAGLLHVLIGSIPEQYQWFMSLLGMNGTVKQGLEELEKIDSNHLFRLEAKAIYHLINAYLLNKGENAVQHFKSIYLNHPNNKLLGYLYMTLLVKNAQSAEAIKVFHHLEALDESYLEFNFLNYVAGEIYLQKGDYQLAENYFNAFIQNTKGRNFTKDAYYKLFLVYWLQGYDTKAIKAHTAAQSAGEQRVEADKHAAKILSRTHLPNKLIMRIRLYTDGGFYTEAIKLIAQDPVFEMKEDKIEFIYRKARLYHKIGNIESAIGFYREAIAGSAGETWYFAPNSCLQLGYISDEKEDRSNAIYYFNQVLSYEGHPYKSSLDNKAKLALSAYEQ